MQILHVICSPRGQVSESYRISQKIIGFLLKSEPTATLVDRVIGSGTITHADGNYATALGSTQQSFIAPSWVGSFSQSEDLIRELESSDFVVIGTPMHNFTVPSALKAWIDHIVRSPPHVQRNHRRKSRNTARPTGFCCRVLGRQIFWGTCATAGLSYSIPKSHFSDHWTA